MICSQCGHTNRDNAKFCDECGASLALPEKVNEKLELSNEASKPQSFEDTSKESSRNEEAPKESLDEAVSEAESAQSSAEKVSEADNSSQAENEGSPEKEVSEIANEEATCKESTDDDHKTGVLDLPPFSDEDFSQDPVEDDYDFPSVDGVLESSEVDKAAEAILNPDTSGFDEYLLDSSYIPPQKAWKSGDTMEMPRVEDEPSPKKVEYRAPEQDKKPRKGRKAFVITLVLLVVMALAAVAVTYQMEIWGGKSLPDVEGEEVAKASEILESNGFLVKVMEVKSDGTEGIVLLMDPGPNRRLVEGSEVVLQVSAARVVPEAIGLDVNQVIESLKAEGFENIEQVQEKSDEAENTVLSITPEAGTRAQEGTKITITVAEPYLVPDAIGKDIESAYALLQDEGFQVSEYYEYSEEPEYTVISTDPAPGTKIASGSTITIHIAKSRASELLEATTNYLSQLSVIELDGTTYDIQSTDGIKYLGDNMTQATLTVVGVTTLPDGEVVSGSPKQRTITISWNDDNSFAGYSS